jgi:hypothetical protein
LWSHDDDYRLDRGLDRRKSEILGCLLRFRDGIGIAGSALDLTILAQYARGLPDVTSCGPETLWGQTTSMRMIE